MATGAQAGTRFRLKLVPLLVATLMGAGLPILAAYLAHAGSTMLHIALSPGPNLTWLYVQHGVQLLVALIAIAIVKHFVPADYGLHWPRGPTYIGPAIRWGIFFGVLMTVIDYAPQWIGHTRPDLGYPLTASQVAGWLFFEGVFVGPTEEIPFRALVVTYLATTMPGKLRIGGFEMNWAGVIAALLFSLAHAGNFALRGWALALGQQFYAFALGVLYAYWLEKSKSVVAPIVGHNVSDGVEYALLFIWVLWF